MYEMKGKFQRVLIFTRSKLARAHTLYSGGNNGPNSIPCKIN